MRAIWTCPSCGWRQSDDRPRICGRYGEPCPGLPLPAGVVEIVTDDACDLLFPTSAEPDDGPERLHEGPASTAKREPQ